MLSLLVHPQTLSITMEQPVLYHLLSSLRVKPALAPRVRRQIVARAVYLMIAYIWISVEFGLVICEFGLVMWEFGLVMFELFLRLLILGFCIKGLRDLPAGGGPTRFISP